jgi:hypothetical protein
VGVNPSSAIMVDLICPIFPPVGIIELDFLSMHFLISATFMPRKEGDAGAIWDRNFRGIGRNGLWQFLIVSFV